MQLVGQPLFRLRSLEEISLVLPRSFRERSDFVHSVHLRCQSESNRRKFSCPARESDKKVGGRRGSRIRASSRISNT